MFERGALPWGVDPDAIRRALLRPNPYRRPDVERFLDATLFPRDPATGERLREGDPWRPFYGPVWIELLTDGPGVGYRRQSASGFWWRDDHPRRRISIPDTGAVGAVAASHSQWRRLFGPDPDRRPGYQALPSYPTWRFFATWDEMLDGLVALDEAFARVNAQEDKEDEEG